MIVGHSKNIPVPYLDKKGINMATGGGTILLQGDENWYEFGHNAAYTFDRTDYTIFHGYDAHDEGKPKLIIKKWPGTKTDGP